MKTMTAEQSVAVASSEVMSENELSELMVSRAQMYGMLARLYRVEVDKPVLRELQSMRFPAATGNAKADEGYHLLFDYLKGAWEDSITELAIDYVRTFIGHGVNGYSAAYPFESVYTSERRLLMQEARAEVLATLREHNLKRDRWTEGEDHIAIELEFMQRLSLETADKLAVGDEDGAIANIATMRSFAEDHLLNWLPFFVSDMRKYSQTLFYQGVAQLTMGYVEDDFVLLTELLEFVQA